MSSRALPAATAALAGATIAFALYRIGSETVHLAATLPTSTATVISLVGLSCWAMLAGWWAVRRPTTVGEHEACPLLPPDNVISFELGRQAERSARRSR